MILGDSQLYISDYFNCNLHSNWLHSASNGDNQDVDNRHCENRVLTFASKRYKELCLYSFALNK